MILSNSVFFFFFPDSEGVRMAAVESSALHKGKEKVEKLQKGIAEFYDESSGIWEEMWGEHMHHGFYEPDSTVSVADHRSAQIRMIEEALRFSSVSGDPSSTFHLLTHNFNFYLYLSFRWIFFLNRESLSLQCCCGFFYFLFDSYEVIFLDESRIIK